MWSEEFESDALELAMELREAAIGAEVYMGGGGLRAQLRQAERQGLRACVIFGPDERRRDVVTVKHMASGDQATVARGDVVRATRRPLAG